MTLAYSSHPGRETALVILLSLLGLVAAVRPAHGQGGVADSSVLYALGKASAYEVGCFGPCDCAVRSGHTGGSFRLRRTSTGPLHTTYAIEDLRATVETPDGPRPATGTGTYELGGEFAATQRLVLDLVIGGDVIQRFDSGMVPGGGSFPAIDVTVAAHQFACYDTVIRFAAEPAAAGVPVPESGTSALRVAPNPFRGATELQLAAPAGGADARIVDAQGREVASLAASPAGTRKTWTWDGRGPDGATVGPGVYFGVVRAPGSQWARRIVKLE